MLFMALEQDSLRGRIALSRLTHDEIAREAGFHASVLSRVLRGLRPPPDGFEERVSQAVDRLEAAERAASEARARVLAGKEGVA